MPSIPFEAELRKIAGGQVIVKSLQKLVEGGSAVPFRVGANAIHAGVDSPEGAENGDIGDLYLRRDGSSAGTETRVGVVVTNGLGSLNAPTLYTKVRRNASTRGWAPVGAWQSIQSTETGTINNWTPAAQTLVTNAYVEWSGASGLTVTGVPKGYNGQLLTIRNTSSGQVLTLSNASASSTYGNRLANLVTSGVTQLAQNGYAQYIYQDTVWRLFAHDQGNWITPAFAAGDYTGSGAMTWTLQAGDVVTAKYRLAGKALIYTTYLDATTVGGTPALALQITLPNSWTIVGNNRTAFCARDNGGSRVLGIMTTTAGTGTLQFYRFDVAAWAASTDNTTIEAQLSMEIN